MTRRALSSGLAVEDSVLTENDGSLGQALGLVSGGKGSCSVVAASADPLSVNLAARGPQANDSTSTLEMSDGFAVGPQPRPLLCPDPGLLCHPVPVFASVIAHHPLVRRWPLGTRWKPIIGHWL